MHKVTETGIWIRGGIRWQLVRYMNLLGPNLVLFRYNESSAASSGLRSSCPSCQETISPQYLFCPIVRCGFPQSTRGLQEEATRGRRSEHLREYFENRYNMSLDDVLKPQKPDRYGRSGLEAAYERICSNKPMLGELCIYALPDGSPMTLDYHHFPSNELRKRKQEMDDLRERMIHKFGYRGFSGIPMMNPAVRSALKTRLKEIQDGREVVMPYWHRFDDDATWRSNCIRKGQPRRLVVCDQNNRPLKFAEENIPDTPRDVELSIRYLLKGVYRPRGDYDQYDNAPDQSRGGW